MALHVQLTLALCMLMLAIATNAQRYNQQALNSKSSNLFAQILNDEAVTKCPTLEEIENASEKLCKSIRDVLYELIGYSPNKTNQTNAPCGGPGWRKVTFINMTDAKYTCPQGLKMTSYAKRACQPIRTIPGCDSVLFKVEGGEYSRVCGRMRGYQVGSTSAFALQQPATSIDQRYVEGVTLTHGVPGSRQHVWTFAAGIGEGNQGLWGPQQCPCDSPVGAQPPSFVGDDYFCESGVNTGRMTYNTLYPEPLWDGFDCTLTSTCCNRQNLPWFTKDLPSSTSDDLEMRVCFGQRRQETVLLDLVELYVQ